MKFVLGFAAMLVIAPANAWDTDPATFRADPQAWVRNTLVPGCRAPAAKDATFCDCLVPLLAARTTEAEVARVNDPDFKQVFGIKAVAALALCKH